jgi:hypothetical protein
MTIAEKTFTGIPGAFSIQDASLANVIPLRVCREGMGFTIVIATTPGNRDCKYEGGEGKLTFLDAFAGSLADDTTRSQIYIRYKY